MAKTYPWSTIIPAGTEQASTADDHIRRLRLEIEERMNDIVEDWSADPVVLQTSEVFIGTRIVIHSCAFTVEPDTEGTVAYGDTNLEITTNVQPMRAPVPLRAGLAIQRMRALVTHGGGSGEIAIALKTLLLDNNVPTALQISRLATSDPGQHMLDSVDLAFTHTIDGDEALFLVLDNNTVISKLHWVELWYTQEDNG
jgi:hypothetical protein